MAKIKAVLWDLDSTLLDFEIPERIAIQKCFKELNLGTCPEELLKGYHDINIKWWNLLEKGLKSKAQILVGRFTETLKTFGYDSTLDKQFAALYESHLGEVVFPIKNAIETVTYLKGKVFQGIVTNGVAKVQHMKLATSKIDKLVDKIYISDIIGYEKPSKKFFDAVLADLPMYDKDQIMIVGDSLSSDMKGGNNADIVCCWFNPKHLEKDRSLKIDYQIEDIKQVIDIVGE